MNWRGKNVVVTGADGFIGSHVAEALVATGANVTALALYNAFDSHGWLDTVPAATRGAMRLVRGDIRDTNFVQTLLAKQDICLHLAALIAIPYSYDAPRSYVDTNIVGTLNILDAARNHNLSRVVHTSTSEVYGTALTEPINEDHPLQGQSPYSASKISADMMAEAYTRSFETPVVIFRPFNTFGPRQSERAVIASSIRQALDPNCDAIQVGDLTTRRDFTYVSDTVRGFLELAASDGVKYGDVYNGGTGKAVTIGETVELIAKLAGTNKPVKHDKSRMRPAASEVRALLADHTKIKKATGWTPAFTLEQGLAETIAWWKDRIRSGQMRAGADYIT